MYFAVVSLSLLLIDTLQAKQFDDDLHNQATQAKMKGKEEMNKLTEQAEKKVEEASNKKTAQLAAAKRAEALLDAQTRYVHVSCSSTVPT
jgi:hypothetical protein